MRKNKFDLTKGEESMMEIFWDADNPLTIMEVSRMTDEDNYYQITMRKNSSASVWGIAIFKKIDMN